MYMIMLGEVLLIDLFIDKIVEVILFIENFIIIIL